MKDSEKLREAVESLEGDFELIRELGRGATSVVYLLRDRALDRDVAMKVIRTGLTGDEEAVARLQREARLVAQLLHPNIVKLYGTHRLPDGSLALLMEHVPGKNLKEVLREEGAFPPERVIRVLKDVASALAYAHRRRIVHRDVKPENIYIDEEVEAARLADFGVARPWDQDARLTLPGASLGTPAYMSPEQIDGLEVDGRTDVYSLGLVGYELLLGHHPWEGENVFTIIYRQKHEVLSLSPLGLEDHPGLAHLLEKALQKNPQARWESAVAFLNELAQVGPGGGPPATSATSSPELMVPTTRDASAIPPASDYAADLTPVDWSTMEADVGGTPTSPREDSAASTDQEEKRRKDLLGAEPRRRWGRWAAAAVILLAIGSFGAYRWLVSGTGSFWGGGRPGDETDTGTLGEAGSSLVEAGPVALTFLSEGSLEGPVGTFVPFTVEVSRGAGSPVADTVIRLLVTVGDAVLPEDELRTDLGGLAKGSVQLPTEAGPVVVQASLEGAQGVESFLELTALVGEPSQAAAIYGDQQTADPGAPLEEPVGVRVRDQFGNPVPEVEVRFQIIQGGGRVSPSSAETDEAGRVYARWTLGNAPGTQLLGAVVPGTEDALVTFQATATAPEAPAPPPREEPEPEIPAPEPAPGPVEVVAPTFAVGGSTVCHLVRGNTSCRGANDRGQGGGGSLVGLVGLAEGVAHGCGLDVSGSAWCWGANDSGQLGEGSTQDRSVAVPVDTSLRFSLMVAGLSHTCALGAGGIAYCWGRNLNGQLGDGTRDDKPLPERVSGSHVFRELVAGWNHTCGITWESRAFCWGSNENGQLGDGSRVDRLVPTLVGGSFRALAAGAGHTCGISGGEVLCWGRNQFGQIGDGTAEDRLAPVTVPGLPDSAISVAAGAVHTCALLTGGTLYCWGQNLHGQLGDGTTQNRSSPVAVAGNISFITVSAGGGVTCGFDRDGGEYCWGLNNNGQLGDGTRTNRSTPTKVGGDPL